MRLRDERTEHSDERNHILDAAARAIAGHRQGDPGVHDILREAAVSGRTLYAHFSSKDVLYVALLRREFDQGFHWIMRQIEAAESPLDQVESWLDAYLDWYFNPEQRARVLLVMSGPVTRAVGYLDEVNQCRERVAGLLASTLTRANAAGQAASATPRLDAATIRAAIDSVSDDLAVSEPLTDRESVRAHVKRFCWPAIGLAV